MSMLDPVSKAACCASDEVFGDPKAFGWPARRCRAALAVF